MNYCNLVCVGTARQKILLVLLVNETHNTFNQVYYSHIRALLYYER